MLYVTHKPERSGSGVVVPARSVITLRASRTLKAALAGTRPAAVESGLVDDWLARLAPLAPPVTTAEGVAHHLARACPDLLALVEADEREVAQAQHAAACEVQGIAPGTVVAAISDPEASPEDVDHWALRTGTRDPIVIRTQMRLGGELPLSRWFGAMAGLAGLSALAGDRMLAPGDLRRVLAALDALAPGVWRVAGALPY